MTDIKKALTNKLVSYYGESKVSYQPQPTQTGVKGAIYNKIFKGQHLAEQYADEVLKDFDITTALDNKKRVTDELKAIEEQIQKQRTTIEVFLSEEYEYQKAQLGGVSSAKLELEYRRALAQAYETDEKLNQLQEKVFKLQAQAQAYDLAIDKYKDDNKELIEAELVKRQREELLASGILDTMMK